MPAAPPCNAGHCASEEILCVCQGRPAPTGRPFRNRILRARRPAAVENRSKLSPQLPGRILTGAWVTSPLILSACGSIRSTRADTSGRGTRGILQRPHQASSSSCGFPWRQCVLPDMKHLPTDSAQFYVVLSISLPIPKDFRPPELTMHLGNRTVFRTPVPETTVYKDRQTRGSEDKVRPHPRPKTLYIRPVRAWKADHHVPSPAGHSERPHDCHEPQLSALVLCPTNARHHP